MDDRKQLGGNRRVFGEYTCRPLNIFDLSKRSLAYINFRRIPEFIIVLLLLPLFLSIILLASIAVYIDNPGRVFFLQRRIGRNGIIFHIIKIRTMYEWAEFELSHGRKDRRITRVGSFLRQYHLDELPQIFNILRGEMSLIGPRPIPEISYNQYIKILKDLSIPCLIRPGITGLSQVHFGYSANIDEEKIKLSYDLEYMRSASLFMDMKIIILTIVELLTGRKSR